MTDTMMTDVTPVLTVDLPACPAWCNQHDDDGAHLYEIVTLMVANELQPGEVRELPVTMVASEYIEGRQVHRWPTMILADGVLLTPDQARGLSQALLMGADLADVEAAR